jgi:hypothetical protein
MVFNGDVDVVVLSHLRGRINDGDCVDMAMKRLKKRR